jgi:hypothetical protein
VTVSADEGAKPAAAANDGAKAAPEPAPGGDKSDNATGDAGAPEATGRGVAAAAASPGGTRARNAQRDSARRNLDGGVSFDGTTTLTGDTVLGGKHIYYQATSTRREFRGFALSKQHIETELGTYVRPKMSRERHPHDRVTILRGTPGSGRNTTALSMLNEPSRRVTIRLDPRTVLEALDADRLENAAGYVLDGSDGDEVTAFELQRVDSELHSCQARLVIVVSDRFRPVDPVLADRVIDVTDRADPLAVVRAHLHWHGSRRGVAKMASLLDEPDTVLALLPETARSVGDYAQLGRLLVDSDGDLDVVRRRLDMRNLQDFEKWFDDLPTLYAQCFAIALSVLNSLPHQAVAETARALELLLDPKDEREKRAEAPKPFQTGRKRLLEQVRAAVATRTVETRHGTTPAEVVTYLDATYPPRLLRYVWQEHDEVRGPLVEWLNWLGKHGSDAVRVAGAIATGLLAVASFDFVRSKVLLAWALHEYEVCRESAAIALEAPAADDTLRATVTGLITEWARSDNTELAATAARSCGAALGGKDTETALSLLDELIVEDNAAILGATCVSLAEWVGGDDVVLRNRGLTAIHDWSVDRDPEKRTAGQLVFLWVAMDLITEDDPWPAVLKFACEDGTIAQRVVALWSAALVNPELSEFARRVLATWADTVNDDNAALTAFVDLCARTGNRSRAVINHQARNWLRADADQHCPRTAAAVLNAM